MGSETLDGRFKTELAVGMEGSIKEDRVKNELGFGFEPLDTPVYVSTERSQKEWVLSGKTDTFWMCHICLLEIQVRMCLKAGLF